MKNNIFQNILASLLIAGSLLATSSVFAAEEMEAPAESSRAKMTFDKIMTTPWRDGPLYPAFLYNGWPKWSFEQRSQIIDRMLEQGLISASQAEEANWIELENGPEIIMGG